MESALGVCLYVTHIIHILLSHIHTRIMRVKQASLDVIHCGPHRPGRQDECFDSMDLDPGRVDMGAGPADLHE